MSNDGYAGPLRSWLFVPGDRPERFAKAAASGAHVVVCDLEDGVLPDHKVRARQLVADWIEAGGAAYVRVNAMGTEWFDDDVDAFAGLIGVPGLLVPKSETRIELPLGAGQELIALIETALGLSRAMEIASAKGVARLGFGSYDYAADLGIAHTPLALLYARSTLVMASRAARISAPLDGVTTAFRDDQECRKDAVRSRELGFDGKMCIHPAQVDIVNQVFAPTAQQQEWARRVVESMAGAEHGVVAVDGKMIDGPLIDQANKLLAEAEALNENAALITNWGTNVGPL